MSAEIMQQLYGGEISDFIKGNLPPMSKDTHSNPITSSLEGIYNNQVQPQGSINPIGVNGIGFNPRNLIEHNKDDEWTKSLTATLNKVAREVNLQPDADSITTPPSINLMPQSDSDVQIAQDNVLKAIEELRALNGL